MDSAIRGQITFRERSQQIRDYSGLRYGNITPTDIDGFIEYKDKAFVFIELKFEGAKESYGQTLALERLCDGLEKSKPCLLIIAKHDFPANKDILAHTCKVDRYRYKAQWRVCKENVKELIDRFIASVD